MITRTHIQTGKVKIFETVHQLLNDTSQKGWPIDFEILKQTNNFANTKFTYTYEMKKEDQFNSKDGGKYSATGSSAHYKEAILEYIDLQCRAYGTFLAYSLCFMQADKYRGRAGKKEGVTADKDLMKATFYEKAASYLREIIDNYNENYSDISIIALDKKYGRGRAKYIEMPEVLVELLKKEFCIDKIIPLKSLEDIVNEKLIK